MLTDDIEFGGRECQTGICLVYDFQNVVGGMPIPYSSPRGGQVPPFSVRPQHRLPNNNGGPRMSVPHHMPVFMHSNQIYNPAPILMSQPPLPYITPQRHPGQASGQSAGSQQQFYQQYNVPLSGYNYATGFLMPTPPQAMRQYSQNAAPTQVHPQQPASQQSAANQYEMFSVEGAGPAVAMSSLSGAPGGPNGTSHQLLTTQPPSTMSMQQSVLTMGSHGGTPHVKQDKSKRRPNAIPIINPVTGCNILNDDKNGADGASSQSSVSRESKDEELKTQAVVDEFMSKTASVAFSMDNVEPPQSTTPVSVDDTPVSSGSIIITSPDDERERLNGPVDHESEHPKEPAPPTLAPSPIEPVAPQPPVQTAPPPQHPVAPVHPPQQHIPTVSAKTNSPPVILHRSSMSAVVKGAAPAPAAQPVQAPPVQPMMAQPPPTVQPPQVQPAPAPSPPPAAVVQTAPAAPTAPASSRKPQVPNDNATAQTKKAAESRKKDEPSLKPQEPPRAAAKAPQEPPRPAGKAPQPGARGGPRPVPASTPPPSASTTVVGAPVAPAEFPAHRPATAPAITSSFLDTINYKSLTSIPAPPPVVTAPPTQAPEEKGTNGETPDQRVGGHTKATQRPKKKQNLNQKGMDKVGGSELDAFFDPSSTTGPREQSPAPPPPVELPKELTSQTSAPLITFLQDDIKNDEDDEYSDAMVAAKNEENAKMSAAVANNNNDISKAAPTAANVAKDAPAKSKDVPKDQRIQPSESAASDKSTPTEDAEEPEKGAAEAAEAEAKSSDSEKSDKDEKSEEGAAAVEVLAEENGAAQACGPALPPYSYKDGQWTPLNTEGKKVYDREFLLEIKNSSYALTKPDFKQELDIFRDKPNDSLPLNHRRNLHGSSSMTSRSDMGPMQFRSSSSSNQRGPGMKMGGDRRDRDRGGPGRGMGLPGSQSGGLGRMGGGKGGFGMGGPIGGYVMPQREEPQLHRDPLGGWKPSILAKRPADLDEEAEKLDKFKKKVRGILNKLTPQKFDRLLSQILDIPIESANYLQEMVHLVFEKAVDEPSFSKAYADLCKHLQSRSIEQSSSSAIENSLSFRKVLLNKCQAGFEKNKQEELGIVVRQKEIDETTDLEKKKELKLLLEEDERKIRRKSVGLVRFIGELYKLKMLTKGIMHSCISQLLEQVAEEPLECLCKLLTTIGKELEADSGDKKFDEYFATMKRLSQKSQKSEVSSRIRFMLQDVIELRQRHWKPRREENNPKTIDQINRDADRDAYESLVTAQHNLGGNYNMNKDRRRPRGGPNQDSDGWQTTGPKNSRAPSGYQGPIETSKLAHIRASQFDSDVALGVGSQYRSWAEGANASKRPGQLDSSRNSAIPSSNNRFSLLDERTSNRGPQYGGSSSSMGNKGKVTGSSSLEKLRGMNMRGDSRGSGPPSRDSSRPRLTNQSPATSLSSRGDRDLLRPEGPNRGGSQPLDNREMSEPRVPASSATEDVSNMDEDKARVTSDFIYDEWCLNNDVTETLLTTQEKLGNRYNACLFIENTLARVLERTSELNKFGPLLVSMINDKKPLITLDDIVNEFAKSIEFANDLIVDIPYYWTFIGRVIAPLVSSEIMSFDKVKSLLEERPIVDRSLVFLAILKHLEACNKTEVWSADSTKITDFVPEEEVENFIKNNNLWFLSLSSNNLISAKVKKHRETLVEILQKNKQRDTTDDAVEFMSSIENTVGEKAKIEILTMAVIKASLVDGKLDTSVLGKYDRLLTRYIDNKEDRELICLFAIKNIVLNDDASLPTTVLCETFKHMYEHDIISLEGFRNWQTDTSIEPMESAQRLLATKTLKPFFESLTADEDDEEDEEEES